MKEYKVWAFARSAAPNLPALEEQLADSHARSRQARLHHRQLLHGAEVRHRILATRLIRYADSRAAGSGQRRHGAEP